MRERRATSSEWYMKARGSCRREREEGIEGLAQRMRMLRGDDERREGDNNTTTGEEEEREESFAFSSLSEKGERN